MNKIDLTDVSSKEKERYYICCTYNNTVQLQKSLDSVDTRLAKVEKCVADKTEEKERNLKLLIALIGLLSAIAGSLIGGMF